MDFGEALKTLKEGKKVARAGWNGKGQFVEKYGPYSICHPENNELRTSAEFLHLKNAQDIYVPWVPSTGDLFAEDWEVVK